MDNFGLVCLWLVNIWFVTDPSLKCSVSVYVRKSITLQEVQHQNSSGDAFGGDLDPPPKEERVEENPDQAFPGQSSPRAHRLGLTECGAWNRRH